ncbi:PpiC-type peptidyl-prolyl cis-trans isomerase [Sulfuricella denitrificans skB26]|uniref:peptidylprolyl isomerase n=1 Tax=Sulfuricella denitrificans (strain DSM 22764 / NBRC 105220 / skB26) TaxID=1163617 RepID=S6AL14_SULDS|nr:peptidylprolyl isomerase [Sulfuricella denitrificans]BAN35294.1 PpiC-type peptidyl-prolyl cis-trans isomerase [Sulfuricella denitrificans skB26]
MFSYKSRILAVSIGSMLTLASCNAQDGDKSAAVPAVSATAAIATVNGAQISQARFNFLLQQSQQQGQPDTPEVRKNIREKLIIEEVVAQEALKKGMDKSAEVNTQIDLARQTILIRAYLQDYIKNNPIGDDVLKADYDKIKSQMGDKEYHARHILVEKEADAKDIIAKLKKGEKFEKLAEKSKDPGSKAKGGDLGWAAPANFVPEFSDAMTKLQKGQYTTEPVKSQFGYHIIKLEDSRTMQAPPFDEVKQNLRQRAQQQQIDKMISDLRAKAKIEETADTAAAKK